MKKIFAPVGRAVWSWGALKIVLWTVTLIVLFYVEEDWRGARLWAATKAKWEARGETFDLRKFVPPAVPDEENMGRLPLFRTERIGGKNGQASYLEPTALHAALRMRSFSAHSDFPPVSHWTIGERPDPGRLRAAVAEQYAGTFKQAPPSADPREQLQAIYPFLPELRVAAQERPFCRFDYDDSQALPAGRALELVTSQLMLSRLLTLDAVLALEDHQPDLALDDYAAILKLRTGAAEDPSLVGALVSAGMFSVAGSCVFEGLARHAWSEAQLERLDHLLAAVDFLATYRFAMRSEAAVSVANLDYFRNVRAADLALFLEFEPDTSPRPKGLNIPLVAMYAFLDQHWRGGYAWWPRGWFDENKARLTERSLPLLDLADDRAHQADFHTLLDLRKANDPAQTSGAFLPWRVLATAIAPERWTALRQFASEQVMVDEMRLAGALERYRMKHLAYPSSLTQLVPEEFAVLPRDVTTGQDYRYRLRTNGTFLLYSIGWNGKDDGGTTVFLGPNQQDYEQGDWVWPTSN